MKVFITTSGVGSNLGQLTKYMNKAMIKIGKKPVISYIIDQYPDDVEFVISLGYQSTHIVQYLNLVYPNRKFIFVDVDNYDGPGSSQVYSMNKCKEYLQEPFIYNDCDTICSYFDIDLNFNHDTLYGFKLNNYGHINYDTFDVVRNNYIAKLYKRGTHDNPMFAYVGIMCIYDYKYFWNCVDDILKDKGHYSDFDIFYKYYLNEHPLYFKEVKDWVDTGTIDGIMNARKNCKDKLDILDKNNQAIFIINDKVIKFFTDSKIVSNIIERHNILGDLTHKIIKHTENFFMYDFIEGDTAINSHMNKEKFKKMISYFNIMGLWDKINNVDLNTYRKQYDEFYINKAITRVNKFKKDYLINEDQDIYINDVLIPKELTIENMLKVFKNIKEYKEAYPTNWHGDFTLENIIKNNDKYTLIDCRDNFGGTTQYGDKLYDWGKMNHNFSFNFSSACKGLYYLKENDNVIEYSIMCDIETYKCKEVLKDFVEQQGIRYDYIEFLSGLNWVTMSPLHPIGDLPLLLFYMGKLKMYESLKKLLN